MNMVSGKNMNFGGSKKIFEEIVLLGIRFHKVRVWQLIDYIVQAAKFKKNDYS